MPSLNRNEKVQCGDYGNMYVRAHAARHREIVLKKLFLVLIVGISLTINMK